MRLGEGQRGSSANRTPPRTTSTAAARTLWQPPEELIAPAEEGEDEEGEWGRRDGDGEDEDGDEDHDFVLGG